MTTTTATTMTATTTTHLAYLALGSNLGNRAGNIHRALAALKAVGVVEATSFLYETAPAYVLDQPRFLNAACRLRTALSPTELLTALKTIEVDIGRTKTIRFGPRVVDLDILFYDEIHLTTENLTIPHPRLEERDFVLAPLHDIAADVVNPVSGLTVDALLTQLNARPLPKVMPIGDRLWTWGQKTLIMGIINSTPDSFSEDGLWQPTPSAVDAAVAQAEQFVLDGADVLDIGGISTRPGHELIPVEVEMARVVPVIEAVAQQVKVPISVDTFRAEVAQAAIAAGAQLINDVWGLRFDARIAQVAADADVPLIMMHNRSRFSQSGYEATMPQNSPPYVYLDLVGDIRRELQSSLEQATAQGVARWHQIVDPGMGFGKSVEQHLSLIRNLYALKAVGELRGYPLLFGASRKGFIGSVLGGLTRAGSCRRNHCSLCIGGRARGGYFTCP